MNATPITDANEKTLLQHSVTCPPPLFATVESRIVRDLERRLTSVTAQRDAAWATVAAIKKDFVDDENFGKVVETLFADPLVEAEQRLTIARAALESITHDMGASQNVHDLCVETLKQTTP